MGFTAATQLRRKHHCSIAWNCSTCFLSHSLILCKQIVCCPHNKTTSPSSPVLSLLDKVQDEQPNDNHSAQATLLGVIRLPTTRRVTERPRCLLPCPNKRLATNSAARLPTRFHRPVRQMALLPGSGELLAGPTFTTPRLLGFVGMRCYPLCRAMLTSVFQDMLIMMYRPSTTTI